MAGKPRRKKEDKLASGRAEIMKEPASGGGTRKANEQDQGLATGSEDEKVTAAQSAHEYCQCVASWLEVQIRAAQQSERTLPGQLAKEYPMNKDTRENMLGVVPWDSEKGDTSMWRYPKNKCKGVLHVSCFAYGENAFHGKGIYAVDAVTWLSYVRVPFNMKRLDVVPVLAPGSEALSLFGYGSDGAMVSSTILCALVALVLYAVDTGVQMSDTIVEELNGGNVQYVKHASGMERLVANMVTSNVISKINRSMDDPLLLAAELGRYGLTTTKEIRSVLKAYTVRVMTTPSLSLKRTILM